MRLNEGEGELLRRLASMPFLDRLELVCVSGWSRGSVYGGLEKLEAARLAASFPHASELIPPTRRFHLTAPGLHRLARDEGMTVDELLARYPVSAQWQRILAERLDAVAVIYRLASTISNIAHPLRLRWYRAAPQDAAITLPDGRVIFIVRQGLTSDRTAFAKRMWKLRDGPAPSAVLALAPDDVRLRHAGRLLAGAPSIVFLALERDAAAAGAAAAVWHLPSGGTSLDLRAALSHTRPRGAPPIEEPPERASLPDDLNVAERLEASRQNSLDAHLMPMLLKSSEKRCLDAIFDWPWITPAHLGELLGVKRSRLSQLLGRLKELVLVTDDDAEGCRRLALTDRGLALLSRRDRTSVGTARKRWGVSPLHAEAALTWRNVSGKRSGQLLRNVEHTEAVHWFVAVLSRQARSRGWEVVQLDPPRRASRYFRHEERLHSVRPDAFGIVGQGEQAWPFFLEWERRAVRPVTMTARLAPYLRYYSSHRPIDDHGAQPSVLVVFDDDLAETHFLRVAREDMARTRVQPPLWVSHTSLLERVGPLGPAWRTPDGSEPTHAFPGR